MIRALAGDFCTHGRTVACRPGAGNRAGTGDRNTCAEAAPVEDSEAPRAGPGRVPPCGGTCHRGACRTRPERDLCPSGVRSSCRRRPPVPGLPEHGLCLPSAVRGKRPCRRASAVTAAQPCPAREKTPGKRPSAGAGDLPKLRLWAIDLGPDAQKPRRRRLLTAYAVAIRGKDHEERYPSQGVQRHHYLRLR
ncbi:hypothetical protein DESPIG_01688 [Desulfovibrio piger ATCC 29098]|uniref:Uncharacterized protein n=1 Tax=Desulfovibrio piger ATCC 29098 TaxID=411464 RepID=B6WUC9_9BACT|nr:hypothetical protein DESPIG_01688 [Desulfovibrio piger ATCC 29098]